MSEAVRQGYPALGPLEFQNRAGGDMAPVVRRLPGKMAPRDGRGVAHDDVASSRPNHPSRLQMRRSICKLGGQCVDDPVELRGDGVGVGLIEDRAHLGGHVRLRRLRDTGQQVAQVVDL